MQGHVAYPQLVKNPVHLAAPALAELAATTWDEGNEYFPPTSFQISNAHAGTGASNVVPGTLRNPVQLPLLHRQHRRRPAIPRACPARPPRPRIRHPLDPRRQALPDRRAATWCEALTDADPAEAGIATELSTTGGTSDGRFIADICPEVVEFGPVNATIHKVDECIAVADLEPLARIYEASLRTPAESTTDATAPSTNCITLRDWLRWAVSRFNEAGLFFGHGTDNAYDEAAWLILHTLHLPRDRLEPFLDARLTHDERLALLNILQQRIARRLPAAYLTHEAWLGEFRFYVDERVIVPRSYFAELLEDGFAPWIDDPEAVGTRARPVHRLGLPGHPDGPCLPQCPGRCRRHLARRAGRRPPQRRRLRSAMTAIRAIESDLFAGLKGQRYDLIISNPPYVTAAAMAALPAEYRHEPALALAAGDDGLDVVRRILASRAPAPETRTACSPSRSATTATSSKPPSPSCRHSGSIPKPPKARFSCCVAKTCLPDRNLASRPSRRCTTDHVG